MTLITWGVLVAIAVVVSGILLLIDRRPGIVRIILTLAATLGGAWVANHFAGWLTAAGVLVVPAVVGALAAALLLRALTGRFAVKRRVE